MTKTDVGRREFTLTWTLPAPPANVFRAWTDPDHLGWFYNPEQPAATDPIEVDLRVGGAWRQTMVIDPDTRYTTGGIYLEARTDPWLTVEPDSRLSARLSHGSRRERGPGRWNSPAVAPG